MRVTVPCTMNGQIAPGEVNRYRFQANKGQRLVISAKARDLVPYVADGVPGWFQAVLRLSDSSGKELAYDDDFRSNPDPVIYFEVPEDGEFVLAIHEALFRGRESFVYRITVVELPFVTSIFPLGGRVGQPVKIEMDGWNLEKATLSPPSQDAKPGTHLLAAANGSLVSNYVPFALDTLPECLEQEANDEPSKAQKVTLPIIINGRSDRPGDWDVFEVEGKAGETIVAEVTARRLGSPLDSFLKVTGANGKIIALNDDHFDVGSGMNTDHADSYLMVKLPGDGKYYHPPRRHAPPRRQRVRLSAPDQPAAARFRAAFDPLPDLHPQQGFGVGDRFRHPQGRVRRANQSELQRPAARARIARRHAGGRTGYYWGGGEDQLTAMEAPVNVTLVGTAKIGDREVVHAAVPSEDKMQAFLWRHLLPAETLPVLVFDSSYQSPADRIRPPILDADRPKDIKPTLTRSSVEWYLRQLEGLYQDWFLTDEFVNREIAKTEASVIQ